MTSLQQRVQEILKPSEGTTQRLNISGARFNAQKDTATDQSYSHVSNQPNKSEHSGARPKDRPPETDRYPKPSLLNSLKDGVPKKDTEPVPHGVANTVSCERVASEGEEIEDFDQDIKRKEHEIRAEKEREKREREAWELEQPSARPQQQEPVTVQSSLPCEHYQRHCRVRFPCCNEFYSCHHCHNKSKDCNNKKARASHATHLKCSYCHDEQEVMKGF